MLTLTITLGFMWLTHNQIIGFAMVNLFYIVDNAIEINEKPTAVVVPMINQNDHDTDDDNDDEYNVNNNNNNIDQITIVLVQTRDMINQLINNLTQQ